MNLLIHIYQDFAAGLWLKQQCEFSY